MDPVRISSNRPRYWEHDGELTLLLGGSSEDNLFQVADIEAELDRLAVRPRSK
jgi:hypothetical protein